LRDNNSVVETVPNGRKKLDEIKQRVVDEQLSSFTYKKIDNSGDASVTLSKSETMLNSDNLVDCEGSVTLIY
jgi:ribose 1,5-bisphosphokinase PhnN